MAWIELMESQQPHLPDEPRRSRRTASAQLVVSTDHTHSTDITIEADDDKPPSPTQPAVLPDLESPLSPPSASSTPSQSATFGRTRSATIATPLGDDEQKPSSIGPQRVRSATLSSPSASTARTNLQKRKRSRVTPEQLAHLERVFAQDRSPTAARRKEISEQLGMQERQTQIWFQNRRAKAKLVESKGRSGRASPGSGRDTPPDTPPELSPGYEADLQALLHETEPISIIPCTDLTIGSWHRIADRTGRHDLVAYISDHKASLTWFIHSGGHGFKMEIPISSVVRTEFSHSTPTHPGHGIASFYLSEKPIFYMEDTQNGTWQVCDDWTEGRQASHIMKHQLVGSSVTLGHAIRVFEARRQGHIPRPMVGMGGVGMSGMQIPQPPLLGVQQTNPMFTFPNRFTATHGRKRSYSGPPAPVGQVGQEVFGPDYAEESRFGSFQMPLAGSAPGPSSHSHGHAHQNSMTDFTSIPISQSLSRPYSADPARQFTDPRPYSSDPSRPFTADPTQQPPRPYMDRRATFDVSAHGHQHGLEQRRYSEMSAEFGGYSEVGYGGEMFMGSNMQAAPTGMGMAGATGMAGAPTGNMGMVVAGTPTGGMGMAGTPTGNMGMATSTGSPMFGMGMPMGYTGLEDVGSGVGDMMNPAPGSGPSPPGSL